MTVASFWYATPWMVRTFAIGTIAVVLLIIALRITKEIVHAKQSFET
jgi:hypothetical protein